MYYVLRDIEWLMKTYLVTNLLHKNVCKYSFHLATQPSPLLYVLTGRGGLESADFMATTLRSLFAADSFVEFSTPNTPDKITNTP